MKSNYIYVSFVILSCSFYACHNHTAESRAKAETIPSLQNSKAETIPSLQNSKAEEISIITKDDLVESREVTTLCEKLQIEYALLIEKLNGSNDDKQLISELIAWTTDAHHLDCLENDPIYNRHVEKLNETL